jgi:hypothetical protein
VVEFHFADSYRSAGMTTSADTLRMRQEPFGSIRKTIDPHLASDLVRLYFGMPPLRDTDWFRDAFGATDSSFSLIDNAREVSVLAAGLLEAAVLDGKVYAALATLTASASGLRQPSVRQDLLGKMGSAIQQLAVNARRQVSINPNIIDLPGASKLSAELVALGQSPEIGRASGLIKKVSDESTEIVNSLAGQVRSVTTPLASQVAALHEEVEMLWWHIGGWSRLLDVPFSSVDPGVAAILAGVDMADMSISLLGPAAASALLLRTIASGRKGGSKAIAIGDAVDVFPHEKIDRVITSELPKAAADICPVLNALSTVKGTGPGTSWRTSFARTTGLDARSTLSPINLAMQTYRERLLLRSLA